MESRRAGAGRGALWGAAAWLAYGTAEYAAGAIAPQLVGHAGFRMLHRDFAAALLVAYAVTGLAAGAAAAAVFRAAFRGDATAAGRRVAAAAYATIALLFAANLAARFGAHLSALPAATFALAALLAAALLVAAASDRAALRLSFAAHPAVVAIVLVAPPWITKDLLTHQPVAVRAAAAVALCAVVLAASWAAHRRRSPPRAGRVLGGTAAAAVVAFAAGLALNRVPGPAAPASAGARPPHVVLVVLDTVRADHLSLYGYGRPTSPRLAELAREATVFTRAVASGDMTLSTHASLFTGKSAREHGAHHPDPAGGTGPPAQLAERFETMAALLGRHGFVTAGVVANHGYLGPFFRLGRGFAYWDSRPAPGWTSAMYYLAYTARRAWRAEPASPEEAHRAFRSADEIDDEVFALLDVRPADAPLCLFVNYMDAHFPYVPPPPFDSLFPGRSGRVTVPGLERKRRRMMLHGGTVTEEEREHLLSQYDGGIAYVDSRLGRLIDRLKRDGLWDDALVVVTSDHGEAFGERGLIDHGVSVYQDQVWVPLVVKYPRDIAPAVVDEPVSSVDVFPTVLDVVGIDAPEGVRGRSLRRSGAGPARAVVAEHYPFEQLVRQDPEATVARALVDGRWKLVRRDDGREELYDLDADPAELRDLRGADAARAEELGAALDRWLEETPAAETAAGALDEDASERLKALGYVQ